MDQSSLKFIAIMKFLGVCPLAKKIGMSMELQRKGTRQKMMRIFTRFSIRYGSYILLTRDSTSQN